MGVSIHFSGVMDMALLKGLQGELEDVARSIGFDESIVVDDVEKGLWGIILRPKSQMEAIPFLFDKQGRLHALCDLIVGWEEGGAIFSVAVKTQGAECTDHIWLVGLLRYVKRKYMPELKVVDEGGFWESEDPVELKRRMESLGKMIEGFGAAVRSAYMDVVVDQETPGALADFVEKVAQEFRARDS